jgi:hypothetical protein
MAVKRKGNKVGIEPYFLRQMWKSEDKEVSKAAESVLGKYAIPFTVQEVKFKDPREGFLLAMQTDLKTGLTSLTTGAPELVEIAKKLEGCSKSELITKLRDGDWKARLVAYQKLKYNPAYQKQKNSSKEWNNKYTLSPPEGGWKLIVDRVMIDIKHLSEQGPEYDEFGFTIAAIVLLLDDMRDLAVPAIKKEIDSTDDPSYKMELKRVLEGLNDLEKGSRKRESP